MEQLIVVMARLLSLYVVLLALPTVATAQPTPLQVSVQANQPWTDTGIDLALGSNVSITASGTIRIAGSDPGKTPAGVPECAASSDFLAPGLPCYSLIGRIGSGTPFYVGTATGFSVSTSGRLFLGVNDDIFGDNSGSWTATVTVTVTAPPAPPPTSLPPVPGWYSNSGANGRSIIYQDSSLRIMWENSYIYRHPGTHNLYWYAQVEYRNIGSQPLPLTCVGGADPAVVKEHIRGTEGLPPGVSGFVRAEETFCSRNPNLTFSIAPGGAHYSWAIFHNVPPGGEVSVEWQYGFSSRFSPWVDPWHSAYPLTTPRPAECPPELVALGTCQSKVPEGTAPNLIVLVHGCCTDGRDVYEWNNLADTMVGEIIKKRTPWEIVVWDWSDKTSDKSPAGFFTAYGEAELEASALVGAIPNHPYEYVHFIGHSAGATLINFAANNLAALHNNVPSAPGRPFIHLTFLDAYTPNPSDVDTYGSLVDYPEHYSEHYVDRTLSSQIPDWITSTNAILPNAFNFDITNWTPDKDDRQLPFFPFHEFGHQWPRRWYERSVATPGFRYGYLLSLEGGGGIDRFNELANKWPASHRREPCVLENKTTARPQSCDFTNIPPLPLPTPVPTPPHPGAAIACQGAACRVPLACNNNAQCITKVTILIRTRGNRSNGGAVVKAQRTIRLASSIASIAPSRTVTVRTPLTKRGKAFVRANRAGGKKRFNGTLQLRNVLTGAIFSNTPIKVRIR